MSITKSLYALAASLMVAENSFAATPTQTFWDTSLKNNLGAGGIAGIERVIVSLLSIVTIIAVGFALYAGFQILTAGGDEEKVKSGRKTIINVIIGLVVMWLSYAIVTFIIGALAS